MPASSYASLGGSCLHYQSSYSTYGTRNYQLQTYCMLIIHMKLLRFNGLFLVCKTTIYQVANLLEWSNGGMSFGFPLVVFPL